MLGAARSLRALPSRCSRRHSITQRLPTVHYPCYEVWMGTSRRDELEIFKRDLDLRAVAASYGFALVPRSSSPGSSVMIAGDDKIIVGRSSADQHWIYFSVRDASDNGSVIDFVQNRSGGSLGEVRKRLRPFLGRSAELPTAAARASFPDLKPVARDILGVRARFEAMRPVTGHHPYLAGERGLPPTLLTSPRFAGRVRNDERGNAVFPHFDRDGICGYELKNASFTGFSKGGVKGLWASSLVEHDQALVFAESAVDALSYAALHGHARTRFYSVAGQVREAQLELAGAAIRKLPAGTVTLAFDNDRAGDLLIAKFEAVFAEAGREDLSIRIHRPTARGTDWNDKLSERGRTPPPPELER